MWSEARLRVLAVLCAGSVSACNAFLDLDVSYEPCVDPPGSRYAEGFRGRTLQDLRDRCWRIANPGHAPSGIGEKIFPEDGDLVMRTEYEPGSSDRDEWTSTDQAPFFHRQLEGDFLVVARAEASTKASADHCLPAGSSAGIALRPRDSQSEWMTWTVEPFLWNQGGKQADCKEDADETNNPTATVRLRTSGGADEPTSNVGLDGEADIAVCRVGDAIHRYYRQPTPDLLLDGWKAQGELGMTGPVDVGVTATGKGEEFKAAGHFNWVVFARGTWGDGCAGALEQFALPEED